MADINNTFASSLLTIDSEMKNFQEALANFNQQMHGVDNVQLVTYITPAQAAYAHFLEIGARDFGNSSQRWDTIMDELSAAELVRILPFLRDEERRIKLQ